MDEITWKSVLLIYYMVINIYTYILMGIDKRRSKQHKWRISEKTLLSLGFLGGSFGLYLGMKKFKHKTRHKKFTWSTPLFMIFHLILLFIVFISIK